MSEQKAPPKLSVDESGTPPPVSVNVDYERKPILYLPNGKPLVRKAGY